MLQLTSQWSLVRLEDSGIWLMKQKPHDRLYSNASNVIKVPSDQKFIAISNRQLLFIAERFQWSWQLRTIKPVVFHRNALIPNPTMTQAAFRCCDHIKKLGQQANNPFNETTPTTFDVISKCTFSCNRFFDGHVLHSEISLYTFETGKISLADILDMPDQVPRWWGMVSIKLLKYMKSIVDDVFV